MKELYLHHENIKSLTALSEVLQIFTINNGSLPKHIVVTEQGYNNYGNLLNPELFKIRNKKSKINFMGIPFKIIK